MDLRHFFFSFSLTLGRIGVIVSSGISEIAHNIHSQQIVYTPAVVVVGLSNLLK